MKLILAAVGRLKEPYLVAAEDEYRKRLRPYCTLTVHEAREEAAVGGDEDRVGAGDRADDAVEARLIEERGDGLRCAGAGVDDDDRGALADTEDERRHRGELRRLAGPRGEAVDLVGGATAGQR